MRTLDFIFGIITLIFILVMFIAWLGAKYDFVGRDEEIEKLKIQLEILKRKEEKAKKRKVDKSEKQNSNKCNR